METLRGKLAFVTCAANRVMVINLRGVFLCLKYEIPLMLRQWGGAIVNILRHALGRRRANDVADPGLSRGHES